MVRANELSECQYRDPNVKTFAWWQAAARNDERNYATIQPGMVLQEELSDAEDAIEMDEPGQGTKHQLDGEEWKDHYSGSFGTLTKRKRQRTPESEADALFGQWL